MRNVNVFILTQLIIVGLPYAAANNDIYSNDDYYEDNDMGEMGNGGEVIVKTPYIQTSGQNMLVNEGSTIRLPCFVNTSTMGKMITSKPVLGPFFLSIPFFRGICLIMEERRRFRCSW